MADRHGIADPPARMTTAGTRTRGNTGRLIRERRKRRGLTQPRLAALVGASERTVQGWEAGAPIAGRWRQQLAAVLDLALRVTFRAAFAVANPVTRPIAGASAAYPFGALTAGTP